MNTSPLISVCLPVYNGEEFLSAAIDSILKQTYRHLELLVVDDASTDSTPQILNEYLHSDARVRLIVNTHQKGLIGARTSAVQNARGEFIAFMDADDVSAPNRLIKQLNYLQARPEVAFCGTWVETFGRIPGQIWKLPQLDENIRVRMLFNTPIANPTIMFRREAIEATQIWYDPAYEHAEDYDLLSRLANKIQLANVPEILLFYRTHLENVGSIHAVTQEKVTRNVQLRELKLLGLIPSHQEFEVHRQLGLFNYSFTPKFISAAKSWLHKIQAANVNNPRFSNCALKQYCEFIESDLQEKYDQYHARTSWVRRKIFSQFDLKTPKLLLRRYAPTAFIGLLQNLVRRSRRAIIKLNEYLYEIWRSGIAHAKDILRPLKPLAEKIRPSTGSLVRSFPFKNKSPEQLKIGMAILAHERPEYLEMCLNSLFATKLFNYDITFLIADDGSINNKVREIIEQPRDPRYKIIRQFFPKGPNNAGAAINRAMRALNDLDNFDVIGWTDPDALYHPDWLNETLKIAFWAKEHHQQEILGPFSSFNSSDVDFHRVIASYDSPFGSYTVKEQMGMLNYFYFKKDYLLLGTFTESPDDETLMTNKFRGLGVRNFCTKTSYVEHLGQNSILNQYRPQPVVRTVFGLNLKSSGWPKDLDQIKTLGWYKDITSSTTIGGDLKSALLTDIVICVAPKDYALLPLTIESVRKHLKHPLGEIFLVGQSSSQIQNLANILGCIFINEDSILPIASHNIHYRILHENLDRSGWLFKQLLNLGANQFVKAPYYFAIDADTILLQDQVFERDGSLLVFHNEYFHEPYFQAYHKLIGKPTNTLLSTTCHQMFFSVERLTALKKHIEDLSGRLWWESILDAVDYSNKSGFSEYELYGQWSIQYFANNTLREYWHNISQDRNLIELNLKVLEEKFGANYRSVSLHHYIE